MSRYQVSQRNGAYFVDQIFGGGVPISWPGGGPLPLLPGWLPKRIHILDALSIRVLELENEVGEEAVWLLDQNFVYLTNDIDKLQREDRRALERTVRDGLTATWREFAVSSMPIVNPEAQWLNDLGTIARRSLVAGCKAAFLPECRAIVIGEEQFGARDETICTVLNFSRITRLLDVDLLSAYLSAMETGLLRLPSPVDGRTLGTDISYVLTPGVVAHRFCDTRYGLTFYVIAGLWGGEMFSLYFPVVGLCIYRNNRALGYSKEFLGREVDAAIAHHIFDYSGLLADYFKRESRKPVVKYHQDHLGHHLWNELSGLEEVVKRVPGTKLPDVYICAGDRSEMYGRVDRVFPELVGRVKRLDANAQSFVKICYTQGLNVLLANSQYVSRSLAQRIISLHESDDTKRLQRNRAEVLRAQGFKIVMFGLRVENRTIVNLSEFVQYVVELLSELLGKVAVVIDGHNAVGNDLRRSYSSHGERIAETPPIEVEKAIVDQLNERFKHSETVAVLSTIGAPMSESILWCNSSDFFITPWGAGLAKYRWICNRRGLVLASPHFLREAGRETVHLYDSSEFMEHPTPLDFVSSDDVQDEPESKSLVEVEPKGRRNFSVHREAFATRLKSFVDSTMSTEAPN